jgi:hypothetical protein
VQRSPAVARREREGKSFDVRQVTGGLLEDRERTRLRFDRENPTARPEGRELDRIHAARGARLDDHGCRGQHTEQSRHLEFFARDAGASSPQAIDRFERMSRVEGYFRREHLRRWHRVLQDGPHSLADIGSSTVYHTPRREQPRSAFTITTFPAS